MTSHSQQTTERLVFSYIWKCFLRKLAGLHIPAMQHNAEKQGQAQPTTHPHKVGWFLDSGWKRKKKRETRLCFLINWCIERFTHTGVIILVLSCNSYIFRFIPKSAQESDKNRILPTKKTLYISISILQTTYSRCWTSCWWTFLILVLQIAYSRCWTLCWRTFLILAILIRSFGWS